jgi:hypothetical protein
VSDKQFDYEDSIQLAKGMIQWRFLLKTPETFGVPTKEEISSNN